MPSLRVLLPLRAISSTISPRLLAIGLDFQDVWPRSMDKRKQVLTGILPWKIPKHMAILVLRGPGVHRRRPTSAPSVSMAIATLLLTPTLSPTAGTFNQNSSRNAGSAQSSGRIQKMESPNLDPHTPMV